MQSIIYYIFQITKLLIKFFHSFSSNNEDKKKVQLSYNLVDKKSFYEISKEFLDINAAIEALEKAIEEKWPCSREEEVSLVFYLNSRFLEIIYN
jgi:hypothetical protein